ncbi:MAG TPA: SDR family NAD(P)-dependent oxidoreductase [Candidatus Binatus sp.]|nr:SDR family NAD(P)-dependent oxidoreductase [Candidatus Binatus sp.]
MNLSGNTILITGGTSGIGFELAAELLKLGNTVIITGRDQRRLEEAQRKLPGVHTFQSDVSDPQSIPVLFDAVILKISWPERAHQQRRNHAQDQSPGPEE